MFELLSEPGIAIVLTGALVGAAAALLGPFLILRQNAMLADAIAHAILFGIMVVWLLTGLVSGPVQIVGAGLAGVLCVWLTEALTRTGRVKQDAAIGLVFPVLFAVGVLMLNLFARDVHIDAHTVLLGEIGFVWLDLVKVPGGELPKALLWMGVVFAVNLAFVAIFWKELKLSTFDPVLAEAFGFLPRVLFYALLFLTSTTAVAAFDAVGVILFIAFVIVPPSAAYLLTDRLGAMVGIGMTIAAASSAGGYALAVLWDVSIGGMMALGTGVCFVAALLFGPRYGMLARFMRRRSEALGNDLRALMVHLASHEGEAAQGEENLADALQTHLGWPKTRAQMVLERSLTGGYILRDGPALYLTEKGRQLAEALVEPWRR
ncbi:MAG: metal ABC transporter permease [Pseudomonadota bacterium]